ncbi:ArsR family transcriptional regulator [uncultured Sphaerochaeta sp.]|uniref:ArsR/SmtB family transcription factor n=1 Tax=uncultured Sphaerochaeta sp. TaxID=886478 RepID=UPI0029CA1E04|nr:ArsR family transcriptional regulator [uncultured Sphaerochaeta sp.]
MSKVLMVMADDEEKLRRVGYALSSTQRIQILKLLYYNSYNVKEIAELLDIPASSAALHVRELERADLIQTKQLPGKRGSMKICSRKNDYVNIKLSGQASNINQVSTISMPIGAYTDCRVTPTCGLADIHTIIGYEDRPNNFYLPERVNAKVLWTSSGYVEYKFPFPVEHQTLPKELILTFEACSEAPNFKEDWKSDVTIWINEIECGTWQSPGDFGARRGKLNPEWWDDGVSQYGKLVTVSISGELTRINTKHASNITINDLHLDSNEAISLRIGNKEDARYIGGFNLFGRSFGDYNQDIELSFVY